MVTNPYSNYSNYYSSSSNNQQSNKDDYSNSNLNNSSNLKNVTKVETNPYSYIKKNSKRDKNIRNELDLLSSKGIDTSNVSYDESGKGYSIAPSIVNEMNRDTTNTFVNAQGQRFSARPDVVVTDIKRKPYETSTIIYASGRKENINTGTFNVYGKEYDSSSKAFKPSKTFVGKTMVRGGEIYSDVTGAVNRFSNDNILNPLMEYRQKEMPYRDTSNDRILFNKSLGGTGQFIKGVGDYVVTKPANVVVDYYTGKMFSKFISIPLVTIGTQTIGGRVLGTGLVGFTGYNVVKGYTEAENKGYFLGETTASFISFGKGMTSNVKGFGLGIKLDKKSGLSEGLIYSKTSLDQPFKNGVTLYADVKRKAFNPLLDSINKFSIKTEQVKGFERGRTLPDGMYEVANVPGIGEIKLKAIPSQQAGFKELKSYQGKDVTIVSATTSNPYRNPWYKGFSVKKSFEVIEVPGASADRLKVGGVERGLFSSLPELKTGTTQAYTYYLGEGASLKDVSSGSAKFQLFPTNRLLVEKTKLSNYSIGLFKNIRGLSPNNPLQLTRLQKWSKIENIAGTNRGGFAGVAGYRTELESISTIGSIKTRTPTTSRGKYGSFLGLGDYYIRLKSGKKLEVFNEKTELVKFEEPKMVNNKLTNINKPKSISKFNVSSSKSLRYSPYKDISLSSLSSITSSNSFKSSNLLSSSYSISSKVSSKSSLSSQSSKSSKSNISYNYPFSYRSSRSSRSSKMSSSPYSSRSSISSINSLFSEPKSSKTSYSKWKFGKNIETNLLKKSKNNRESFYVNSIEAQIFNIKAKKSDINLNLARTGLSLRPIIK